MTVTLPSLALYMLSADERRLLARAATQIYELQRYGASWSQDAEQRKQMRLRWQEIADDLHPEPFGPERRAAELAQRAREAAEETP
jgi:hypothetical protein